MRRSKNQKQILLQELEELLERLTIPLRYEKGTFKGGLCFYNEKAYFIINKNLSLDQKLQIFRNDLLHVNLEDLFIRPVIREFLSNPHF